MMMLFVLMIRTLREKSSLPCEASLPCAVVPLCRAAFYAVYLTHGNDRFAVQTYADARQRIVDGKEYEKRTAKKMSHGKDSKRRTAKKPARQRSHRGARQRKPHGKESFAVRLTRTCTAKRAFLFLFLLLYFY